MPAGTPVADRPHVPGNENQNIPAFHNTALPFTRCVAGPADYTPVGFSMPGDVLPVQQLACACLITSPLMTLAENPFYLLREERLHPALEFLRELPVCWNETVVLPQSRVGSLAAFARRSRETWYLAIAAAEAAQETFKLDFLTEGNYTMVLLEEDGKEGFRRTERPVAAGESIPLDLPRNGGAVARFIRR